MVTYESSFEAPSVMVVVVMMAMAMVGVMMWIFLIDDALNVAKLLHVAGNSDRTFLIKAIFILSLLKKLHEERMVDVNHRNHKPLLLLSLTNHNSQTPFWNILQIFLFLMVVMMKKVNMREMNMKINKMVVIVVLLVAVSISGCGKHHVEENRAGKKGQTK